MLGAVFSFLIAANAFAAPCIVSGRGHFNIRTGTSGLFGAFAHDHLIEAQKIEGCAVIDSADIVHSSIKVTFTSSSLKVVDSKESSDNRAKIQKTMETEVLRVSEYPQVVFESTSIERGTSADTFNVRGNLTIRGKAQPVTIPVKLTRLDDASYRATGSYKFKQTSFGIKPIQLAGGTVKVKDEVSTDFELFLK